MKTAISFLMTVANGVPGGIRTHDLRIRSPLRYPAEPQAHILERVMGIEPTQSAWKADVLPLNYTRITWLTLIIIQAVTMLVNILYYSSFCFLFFR
jgi:hypothetical protein